MVSSMEFLLEGSRLQAECPTLAAPRCDQGAGSPKELRAVSDRFSVQIPPEPVPIDVLSLRVLSNLYSRYQWFQLGTDAARRATPMAE